MRPPARRQRSIRSRPSPLTVTRRPPTPIARPAASPARLFWQNRADYRIKATLDPATRKLSGSETISYSNHSPDALDVIWLQVEQNRYRKDARGAFGGDKFPTEFTDGEHIRSVEVEDAAGHRQKAAWVISDTRMQVTLPTPLKAHDGQLKLHIVWDYTVPGEFGGRTDWNANQQGDIFEMAQWYPRVCVYDDLRGWDTQPFLNSEFYLEYGDFDYSVTLPRTCSWSARANCSTRRRCSRRRSASGWSRPATATPR